MTGTRAGQELDSPATAGDPGSDGVIIRRVETREEYDECVRIQNETWGAGFTERVPSTILRISQQLGGVTAAAFAPVGARMLGFVFGMTGVQQGQLIHWSDLLAVRPGSRDRGIGRRLKLFQRWSVLRLGVTRMTWTFDPLVARNAHLNLNALGVNVASYEPDMYGPNTGSALHSAVGTDRFIVTWDLTAEPPPPLRRGAAPVPSALVVNRGIWSGEPTASQAVEGGGDIYIAIPADIHQVVATSPKLACAWRESTRAAFVHSLERGYRVVGFHLGDGHGFYHLARE